MKKLLFLAMIISIFSCTKVVYVTKEDTLDNVNIQPAQALEIAQPFIDEHATYVYRDSSNLKTFIVMKRKYYYVKRTDYPAKALLYYTNKAVRINSKNGKIKFIDK